MALTAKRQAFVDFYAIHQNGTRAAKDAGFSEKSAHAQACRLLKMPEVRDALAELQRERAERCAVTAGRVIEEIAALAFSNLRHVARWRSGEFEPFDSDSLNPEAAAAIAEISFTEDAPAGADGGDRGDDPAAQCVLPGFDPPVARGKRRSRIKMHEKSPALAKLVQILRLADEASPIDPHEVARKIRRMVREIDDQMDDDDAAA